MKALRLALAALLLVITMSLYAAAAISFFPLSQLKAGMKGIGKTVIRGTAVETFNVEILDIIPDGGFDGGPMVLAKFSGPVIEASGGIAEGYSGSPVYIDGKLLGAVSSAIPYSDTHVGGITPIESMLTSLPNRYHGDYAGNTVIPGPKAERKLRFTESWKDAEKANEQQPPQGGTLSAVPLAAPIIASGLSDASLRMLQEKFADCPYLHIEAAAGGAAAGLRKGLLYDPAKEGTLKAGDAAGVSLMTGDIDLSAIGTVTYVDDGGQVLMFGHPFNMTGDIDLPLQKAYIAYTYKSSERPFKVGYTVQPVGAAKQDRACGVGGMLNEVPDMIPLQVKVNDIDLGASREFNVTITRDPNWFDSMAMTAFAEALVRTVNMQNGGTVRMKFNLQGAGLKDPLERTNYFYSDMLPTGIVWEELLPLASLLANNIYREVKLTGITVDLDFTRNRVNAAIDGAELFLPGEEPKEAAPAAETPATEPAPDSLSGAQVAPPQEGKGGPATPLQDQAAPASNAPPATPATASPGGIPEPKTVHPGDTLRVKVKLQPFREKAIEQYIYFTLPEDFPEGPTSLVVHGGGSLLSIYNEFGGRGRTLLGGGSFVNNVPVTVHDLDRIIEKALSTPLNNEIVVTILKPGVDPGSLQNAMQTKGAEDPNWEPDFHVSLPTKWVIYEEQMIPIIVTKPGKDEKPGQPAPAPPAADGGDEGDGEG
jgi:hypothetical protein